MTRAQRNFFLREQLKAIKKELGIEKEGKETEIERFEKRIEKLKLTEEARSPHRMRKWKNSACSSQPPRNSR
jgi:ATP-dependent Lon protease